MNVAARFVRELTRTLREVRRYVRAQRKNFERVVKADRERDPRPANGREMAEEKGPPRRDLVDETLSDLAKWSEEGDALTKDYAALAKDFPLPGDTSAAPYAKGTFVPLGADAMVSPPAESPAAVSVASPAETP